MSNTYIRVAIVDDDSGVRKALSRFLEVSSFGTETFASASEFLKSLPARTPQCLVVDLQMPEMTGLELQYELKRRGINIPTIVITAHNEASAREKCESAGAIAFLLKPLQPDALLATINAATRMHLTSSSPEAFDNASLKSESKTEIVRPKHLARSGRD